MKSPLKIETLGRQLYRVLLLPTPTNQADFPRYRTSRCLAMSSSAAASASISAFDFGAFGACRSARAPLAERLHQGTYETRGGMAGGDALSDQDRSQ